MFFRQLIKPSSINWSSRLSKMASRRNKVGISLGTMTFNTAMEKNEAHQIVKKYMELGYKELDTALVYWGSEEVLGSFEECRSNATGKVHIATKANPKLGKLNKKGVKEQLETSLKNLRIEYVDLYYLHKPDHDTPIEETLEGVDALHKEGKFKEFGLSNYSAWQVAEIWHLCQTKGYVLPTVYQGMYNALTRSCEDELFPALRRYGIRFYVYNPLAGGILSGKHSYQDVNNENLSTGRFFDRHEQRGLAYQKRYWKKEIFEAVKNLEKSLKRVYTNEKVSILEASFRWLTHHSQLTESDSVIIGVSKLSHLEENIKAIEAGPLHEDVVKSFERAWNMVNGNIPKYFR